MDEIIKENSFIYERRMLPEIKLNLLGDRSTKQRFWLALKCASRMYAEHTQVHGFFYLRAIESQGFKRIFWSIVIIISFLIGAYILAELLVQFFRVPITAAHPALLQSVPYPAISLCHPQTVINNKAKKFVDKIRIPDGIDKTELLTMLPSVLGAFTENQWGSIDTNYLSTVNEILQLNDISVLDTVKTVGINCSEFILRCSFNKKRFPCFQDDQYLTFRETMTHVGVCCSFNYAPKNSSYDPLIVNSYGVRGGLSMRFVERR